MNTALKTYLISLRTSISDQTGASALEWAVVASGIAVVAISGISNLGQSLSNLFDRSVAIIGAFF